MSYISETKDKIFVIFIPKSCILMSNGSWEKGLLDCAVQSKAISKEQWKYQETSSACAFSLNNNKKKRTKLNFSQGQCEQQTTELLQELTVMVHFLRVSFGLFTNGHGSGCQTSPVSPHLWSLTVSPLVYTTDKLLDKQLGWSWPQALQ